MRALQLLLGVLLLSLIAYTSATIYHHGWNLLPVFFGDIAAMHWPGQFNFDFLKFLILSGLWVAWRHQFSGVGITLGILAFFGGMLFLSVYLLIVIRQSSGNINTVLLGERRSDAG